MTTHRTPAVRPPPTRRVRLATLMFAIAAVAVVAAVILSGVYTESRFARQEAEKTSLAAQIRTECLQGRSSGRICDDAAQALASPQAGPAGPGPTADQIRDAVTDYLLVNPPPAGRAPTPAEVAAAVAAYLTANPASPGRPPTAVEIAAAVEVYFATNPVPPGPEGQPGRPPTMDEIRVVVDQFLAENPPPAGPRGADSTVPGPVGPPGPQGEPPASYTLPGFPPGQRVTCVRDEGSPDDAPTYTCN